MSLPWPAPDEGRVLYVDEARYVVRLTSYPTGMPEHVGAGYMVWWHEMGVSLDSARSIASGVAWNSETGYFEPHVLRQSYSQVEWGASGYGVEFVLDLINNVAAEMVMFGLGMVVARLRGGKRSQTSATLDDLDMVGVDARRAVSAIFDENWDELAVVEASKAESGSVVVVAGAQGNYRVTAGHLEATGDPFCHAERMK